MGKRRPITYPRRNIATTYAISIIIEATVNRMVAKVNGSAGSGGCKIDLKAHISTQNISSKVNGYLYVINIIISICVVEWGWVKIGCKINECKINELKCRGGSIKLLSSLKPFNRVFIRRNCRGYHYMKYNQYYESIENSLKG